MLGNGENAICNLDQNDGYIGIALQETSVDSVGLNTPATDADADVSIDGINLDDLNNDSDDFGNIDL